MDHSETFVKLSSACNGLIHHHHHPPSPTTTHHRQQPQPTATHHHPPSPNHQLPQPRNPHTKPGQSIKPVSHPINQLFQSSSAQRSSAQLMSDQVRSAQISSAQIANQPTRQPTNQPAPAPNTRFFLFLDFVVVGQVFWGLNRRSTGSHGEPRGATGSHGEPRRDPVAPTP